jgi:hypothetical protein
MSQRTSFIFQAISSGVVKMEITTIKHYNSSTRRILKLNGTKLSKKVGDYRHILYAFSVPSWCRMRKAVILKKGLVQQ